MRKERGSIDRIDPIDPSDRTDRKGFLIPFATVLAIAFLAVSARAAVVGALRSGPYSIQVDRMNQPDARAPGDGSDSDRVETGTHRLLSVIEWGGRRFLHYEYRTYWTADSGRNWKSHGWLLQDQKGPRPALPDARFKSTGSGLFLAGDNGVLVAAAFDPARDDWALTEFGRESQGTMTAMGSDAGVLYLYDTRRILSVSRDNGGTWRDVAAVPPPLGGYFFEAIEAEADRILLRFQDPSGISTDAGSNDGGRTWKWFPSGADVRLHEACFHWISGDSLRSACGPERPDRTVAVTFRSLVRLFRQESGDLFALADSGVFRFQPLDTADPQAAAGWKPVGPASDWQGWIMAGEILSRQTADKVAWVSPGNPIAVALAPRSRARYGSGDATRAGPVPPPAWLVRGRRPDGRSVHVQLLRPRR